MTDMLRDIHLNIYEIDFLSID